MLSSAQMTPYFSSAQMTPYYAPPPCPVHPRLRLVPRCKPT